MDFTPWFLFLFLVQAILNLFLFRRLAVLTQVTHYHNRVIDQLENRPASLTTVVARPDAHHLN